MVESGWVGQTWWGRGDTLMSPIIKVVSSLLGMVLHTFHPSMWQDDGELTVILSDIVNPRPTWTTGYRDSKTKEQDAGEMAAVGKSICCQARRCGFGPRYLQWQKERTYSHKLYSDRHAHKLVSGSDTSK